MKYTLIDGRYHRNGTSGTGFYLIRFKAGRQELLAVVEPRDEEGECQPFFAVLSPDGNLHQRYRAEAFEEVVRMLIAAEEAYDPMRFHRNAPSNSSESP